MNEQLLPVEKAITVRTDGNEPLLVGFTLDGVAQSWDGFTDFELVVADSAADATADLVATVTPQAGGKLLCEFDEAALKTLLPYNAAPANRRMVYALRARPYGTYRVPFMTGQFTINKGLPEATQL